MTLQFFKINRFCSFSISHVLCFLLLSIVSVSLSGQSESKDQTLFWNKVHTVSARHYDSEVIGGNSDQIYILKKRKSKHFDTEKNVLQRYNEKLELTHSCELNFRKDSLPRKVEQVKVFKGIPYVFSSVTKKRSSYREIYVQTLDSNDLKLNAPKCILKEDISQYKWKTSDNFNLIQSSNGSYILFLYAMPLHESDNKKLVLQVYNDQFELQWKKKVEIPCISTDYWLSDCIISNEGKVYLLGKHFKNRFTSISTSKYVIQAFDKGGKRMKSYKVNSRDKFLKGVKLTLDKENNLRCDGFYADKKKGVKKGVYSLFIDEKVKDIDHSNFEELPSSFMREDKNLAYKSSKNLGLIDYRLIRVVERNDGGVYLVAEHHNKKINYLSTFWTYQTIPFPIPVPLNIDKFIVSNDIIVIGISKSGEIDKTIRIPKQQKVADYESRYSSFNFFTKDDKLYFLFNDHVKNLNIGKGENLKTYKNGRDNSVLTLTILDAEGKLSKTPVYHFKDEEVKAAPVKSLFISEKEILIYGRGLEEQRIGRLKFND